MSACLAGLGDPTICLPEGRLRFSGKPDVAHGSVVIGVGVDPDRFATNFAPLGRIGHFAAA